jgi:phosphoribosyl-ATP pyrophosphohydrolase/phosphoribosyl-AMP cyclohydrolase
MIVPSIDLSAGRAVQLRRGKDFLFDGGDPRTRLEEFSVAGEVAIVDLDAALGRGSNRDLILDLVRRAPCRVGGGIRTLEQAREWLDAGATRIVVGTAATPEFCGALPRDRVIAAIDADRGRVVVDGWRTATARAPVDAVNALGPFVAGFLFTQVEHEGGLAGFERAPLEAVAEAAGRHGARVTAAGGICRADEIAELDAVGVDAQIGVALYRGILPLGDGIAAPLAGEGPWPTVVCDELGSALGLVWSTRASIATAVRERRGVYWSRSRTELWRKGDTSGATQELVRIDLDCDRDALRFTVRQRGDGFCHRRTESCWDGGASLSRLERTIEARLRSGDEDSGTRKLGASPVLLASKLVEEASELALADGADEAVHEAADLVYMALVALRARGGDLERVLRELERRSRRVSRRPMVAKTVAAVASGPTAPDIEETR